MASEDVLAKEREERLALIQIALGKVSVDFMRQSKDVVMPTEALLETASQIEEIWAQEITALEAQLAQFRWRRVEEEMPERFMDVLVVDSDGWHFIAHTDSRRWLPNHPDMEAVTHWMPLPSAPEEEE